MAVLEILWVSFLPVAFSVVHRCTRFKLRVHKHAHPQSVSCPHSFSTFCSLTAISPLRQQVNTAPPKRLATVDKHLATTKLQYNPPSMSMEYSDSSSEGGNDIVDHHPIVPSDSETESEGEARAASDTSESAFADRFYGIEDLDRSISAHKLVLAHLDQRQKRAMSKFLCRR